MRITCNANLFRIAYMTVPTEETRYYLNGVFIEPHPAGGIVLVTTDGHRMTVIRDETGHADRPAIVRLRKDALKACKPARSSRTRLLVDLPDACGAARAKATVEASPIDEDDLSPIAFDGDAEVDGTFPDWRRVVPRPSGAACAANFFNGRYLSAFAEIGSLLDEALRGGRASAVMNLVADDTGNPTLVRWSGIEEAFGILMPMRGTTAGSLPSWLDASPAAPALALAA